MNLYDKNEAIFFKLIHSSVYNNESDKEKAKNKKDIYAVSLEEFGIKPMEFTGTMDLIFGNRPKDYLKDFFSNEVMLYLWQGREFHGKRNFLETKIAKDIVKDHKSFQKLESLF